MMVIADLCNDRPEPLKNVFVSFLTINSPETELASFIGSTFMEVVVINGAIRLAKLLSNRRHQQTNTQISTGRMPFLSPHQQCQSTWGKYITFHGLVHPKLTWGLPTLSLTTNSSWLPWGWLACLSSAPWCQYPNLASKRVKLIS